MDQATRDASDTASGKTTKGRKEAGQEATIKMKPITDKIADLVALHIKAVEAKDNLSNAVKAVAEKSGLLASVVNKFVAARAGEKFDDQKTKACQLALVFEEVGAVSGSRGQDA